jgi:hypothetical protein
MAAFLCWEQQIAARTGVEHSASCRRFPTGVQFADRECKRNWGKLRGRRRHSVNTQFYRDINLRSTRLITVTPIALKR